jgi:hypothetical protein
MSRRSDTRPAVRSSRPLASEFGVVVAVLVGVYLWGELVSGALTASALAYTSLLLADGAVVFAFEAGMQNW